MFISATSPLVLCKFVLILLHLLYYSVDFFPARIAAKSIKRINCAEWDPNTNNYVEEHF